NPPRPVRGRGGRVRAVSVLLEPVGATVRLKDTSNRFVGELQEPPARPSRLPQGHGTGWGRRTCSWVEGDSRSGAATTEGGVSVLRGAPWLRFVWSCGERPDPAGRRRVKRSVYLHPKGARGQQHADEAT